jgi:flavin-dependent dehydrogenase
VEGSLGDGFTVTAGDRSFDARLVLGAYGKRGSLDRTLDRDCLHNSDLVAFKAHFAGADVPHTIELHAFEGGYCGCSHVEDDRLNVCWIGTVDALQAAGGSPEAMMEAARRHNPALADRLAGCERVSDRFEAVSQVSLDRKGCFAGGVCMIGDTAQMIAPLCGDGMAMALAAADLVVDPATAFLEGRLSPAAFRRRYTSAWEDAFAERLRVGRWMHTAAFHPTATSLLVSTFRLLPPLARWVIRATRG